MTSRERVLNAIAHKDGSLPIDFGGLHSSIHEQGYRAVRKQLGWAEMEPVIQDWLQMIVFPAEQLLARFGADCIPAYSNLLQETLTALAQIDHPRVQDFVKTLRNHQQHLLTFLDWTAAALSGYRTALAQQWPDPRDQQRFERTVARHWRLQQALINGHHQWRAQAVKAQTDFNTLIGGDPARQHLATRLLRLLDSAGHTSSLIECINGLLKSCLKNRQGFRNLQTLQAYLNLFVLWHNMRAYQRGKRRGQSPYQIAGIDPGTDDWLELLGYPVG